MTERKRKRAAEPWYGTSDSLIDLEEQNVVEFPLALLARHVPDGQKVVSFGDTIKDSSNGEYLNRTCTVSANASSKLPNWWDQDVFVALQVLTNRKHGWREPVVEFTIYEVLQLMRLPNDGKNWRRVAESLDNWQGVRVKYSHWRKGDEWTSPRAFCFIQDYDLTRHKRRPPDQPQIFTWSRIFFESVQASNTKRFDSDFYFSLRLPSSKRMFRLLDKRFHMRATYSYPLVPFCTEKLGMSRAYKPSEYSRKVEPGYDELVGRGFLSDVLRAKRFERRAGVLQIDFRRGRKKSSRGREQGSKTSVGLSGPVRELTSRGVSTNVAVELAQSHREEDIGYEIEYFDWLVAKNEKPEAPGGWLKTAIENGWKAPADFKTKAERKDVAERQRERRKQQEAKKEREAEGVRRDKEQMKHDAAEFQVFIARYSVDVLEEAEERGLKAARENGKGFLADAVVRSRKGNDAVAEAGPMRREFWKQFVIPILLTFRTSPFHYR